ncbi:hypothetical protein DFH08DRAFT_819762 [Mycena albidolilacea]|uniref:F-box domain-containing protein n=1 Tax=Mycena albidolilacea TaxID=1033008 RepID=A0AAD6ZDQ1_9AGAR|nr:hypothetical protein DFH08DRAFT_819762 [Mycena albidolilacea]
MAIAGGRGDFLLWEWRSGGGVGQLWREKRAGFGGQAVVEAQGAVSEVGLACEAFEVVAQAFQAGVGGGDVAGHHGMTTEFFPCFLPSGCAECDDVNKVEGEWCWWCFQPLLSVLPIYQYWFRNSPTLRTAQSPWSFPFDFDLEPGIRSRLELPFEAPGRGIEAVTRLLPTSMASKRGRRLQARRALDARELLPVELWERIFHQVPSTEDLLTRLAGVCTLYNELCIRVCLERQGVSPDDLKASVLHLSGTITRPLCLLPPARTFPARQVSCHVDPDQMPTELRQLTETLARCTSMDALSISLRSDLFPVSQPACEAVLSGLCELLSRVAARNSAPVFVLMGSDMFSCMPEDISVWKLHQFEYSPPPPSRWTPSYTTFRPPMYTTTRIHKGQFTRVRTLTSLTSVELMLVGESAPERLQPFSLLALDLASITQLVLGGHPEEFVPYFSSMLWHISLPYLRNLDIYTDEIDPAALRHFLVHHPLIEHVDFGLHSNDNAILYPLLDAPLAHPNIVTLFARANAEPCVHPIIPFLCACPESVELSLCLPESRSWWSSLQAYAFGQQPVAWASTTDAQAIAARLHNVHKLRIEMWSLQTANQLLPWLAAFPAVTEIDFSLHFRSSGITPTGNEFLHAARQALPNIQGISCDAFHGFFI